MAHEGCEECSTPSAVVYSDRPDGGYGEVDAKVVRDGRTLDVREAELALSGEALTIEAEHGGIIGQSRLKGMPKPTDLEPESGVWDADLHSPAAPTLLSYARPA